MSETRDAAGGRPFLVLFTARSGSTALYGNLASHPDIDMRAEVFGGKTLNRELEQSDDNRLQWLQRFWRRYRIGGDGVFRGFKFQATADDQQFDEPDRFGQMAKEYNPAIIVLRRQNMVKQIVSSMNAHRLKEVAADLRHSYHIRAEEADSALEKIRNSTFSIDPKQLLNRLTNLEQSYAKLDALAAHFDGVLNITYEDYLTDRDAVVHAVIEHIGADPARWEPSDTFVKITSDRLSQTVENVDELRRELDGTKYAPMLIDGAA